RQSRARARLFWDCSAAGRGASPVLDSRISFRFPFPFGSLCPPLCRRAAGRRPRYVFLFRRARAGAAPPRSLRAATSRPRGALSRLGGERPHLDPWRVRMLTARTFAVISRREVKRFGDLTPEEVGDVFRSAQLISRVVEKEYSCESLTMAIQVMRSQGKAPCSLQFHGRRFVTHRTFVFLFDKDGPAAGQTVPHFHVHVIPRRFGDWANNIFPRRGHPSKYSVADGHSKKDDIYVELDRTKRMGVDNDERVPRSEADMAAEAAKLRTYFPDWQL
ncbi:MAG: hypothetical protein BJ554DRAFT_5625, partial [Olpidium bornovanus]